MANSLDRCRFRATSTGTVDFVVSAAVSGYQTPASAGAVNATTYSYIAESDDLSQWEVGTGAYTVSGTTLARTTVLFNSSGTTSKINFTAAPQVAITLLAEDVAGGLTSSTIASGSAISLTDVTAANVTSISIGAGTWDVTANPQFIMSGTSFTEITSSLSTTSATLDTTPGQFTRLRVNSQTSITLSPAEAQVVGPAVFTGPATVYLVVRCGFSAGTVSAYGILRARKVI